MMVPHPAPDQIQDFVDRALPDAERGRVAAHLEVCAACTQEVAALRALLDDVAALPRSLAPGRDLLRDIHRRIDAQRPVPFIQRPLRSVAPWLAAAAVLLVVLSSLITGWRMRGAGADLPPLASSPAQSVGTTEQDYAAALRELEGAYSSLDLPAATREVLDRSLATIDAALREARDALAADPDNPLLAEMLLAGYEKKLGLLRQATALPVL